MLPYLLPCSDESFRDKLRSMSQRICAGRDLFPVTGMDDDPGAAMNGWWKKPGGRTMTSREAFFRAWRWVVQGDTIYLDKTQLR